MAVAAAAAAGDGVTRENTITMPLVCGRHHIRGPPLHKYIRKISGKCSKENISEIYVWSFLCFSCEKKNCAFVLREKKQKDCCDIATHPRHRLTSPPASV
jgi:hypothetical protein